MESFLPTSKRRWDKVGMTAVSEKGLWIHWDAMLRTESAQLKNRARTHSTEWRGIFRLLSMLITTGRATNLRTEYQRYGFTRMRGAQCRESREREPGSDGLQPHCPGGPCRSDSPPTEQQEHTASCLSSSVYRHGKRWNFGNFFKVSKLFPVAASYFSFFLFFSYSAFQPLVP